MMEIYFMVHLLLQTKNGVTQNLTLTLIKYNHTDKFIIIIIIIKEVKHVVKKDLHKNGNIHLTLSTSVAGLI